MSESKKGRDMAATGDEGKGKGRAAMPPGGAPMPPGDNESKGEAAVSSNTENEGKEKTGTTPKADEGPGMDDLSRVKSYEPGNDDQLKPFTSEGETKYEGKGKNRCMFRNTTSLIRHADKYAQPRVSLTSHLLTNQLQAQLQAQLQTLGLSAKFQMTQHPPRLQVPGLSAKLRTPQHPDQKDPVPYLTPMSNVV